MPHFRLAFILALTVALGPFSIDAYLPAFPVIASDLGVSVQQVALSISVYILTLATGQLVGGPLADRYGRQPIMLAGLITFSFASACLSQTTTLTHLLYWRALQAFGAGFATTCVPALVRDQVKGAEAAKLLSLIALIMIAAPAVAPSVGALLLAGFGWHSIFLCLTIYGGALAVVVRVFLFSSTHITAYVTDTTSPLTRYLSVLKTGPAWRFIVIQAATFSTIMLFVTHASSIYQQHYQVSKTLFGLLFGANILLIALMNLVNRKLLNFYSPLAIMRCCLLIQTVAALSLIGVTFWQLPLWCFVTGTVITIGMFGGISSNNQACYMEHFFRNGGTASAVIGAFQYGVAGGISALSTFLPDGLVIVVSAQAACCMVGVTSAWMKRSI